MDEVLIAIRAVHFAATIMVAGAIFLQTWVAEPALEAADVAAATADRFRAQLKWLAWPALAIALLSGAAWLIRVAANISGESAGEALTGGTAWTMLTETQFGLLSIARLTVALMLAACLAVAKPTARSVRWLPPALAACLVGALAGTGHSGAAPGWAGELQLASDVAHLIAAGAWVGGLVPLAMLFALARRAFDGGGAGLAATAARRFSVLGMASVGTLTATGIVNTWVLVGSVSALATTDYGRLLLLKIFLFAVMIAIAAVNRFHLLPKLHALDNIGRIQRNSLAEAVLGLMVIEVVGALGAIPPAAHAHMHMH